MGAVMLDDRVFLALAFRFRSRETSSTQGKRRSEDGSLGALGNVIWFLLAGWWLALGHLSSALACFVTIVCIPFGIQHIKLALIALALVGMTVVKSRN
nr:YccF domain-containing protein [Synechococcus sp. MU1642]